MCDGTIAGRFIKKLTWIKQLMGGTPIVTDVNDTIWIIPSTRKLFRPN